MFTKQHYEAVAKILKEEHEHAGHACVIPSKIAERLAEMFATDNPRFDVERFRAACH